MDKQNVVIFVTMRAENNHNSCFLSKKVYLLAKLQKKNKRNKLNRKWRFSRREGDVWDMISSVTEFAL